jgi:galactitol-specific phosphotransferase system IIB component
MFEFCNQKKVFFRLKNQTNYLDINNLDVDILKNINLGFDLIVSDDFKLEFDKFLKEEAIPSIKNNLIREDEISKTIKEEKAKNRFPISVTGCLHSQNSPNSIVLSSSPSQIQKLLRDFLYRTFFEHLIKENNHNLD